MVSDAFKQDLKAATGRAWEEWLTELQQEIEPGWSHEQVKRHIRATHDLTEEWCEWLAVMVGQLMGRKPVGVTKDAGVQIGVRRTVPLSKERLWKLLTSEEGLSLWLGKVPGFEWRAGYEYESETGISGKIAVLQQGQKIRMTWKPAAWEQPSRLQIYMQTAKSGKTTLAIHQEMLEDVYIREQMRRKWEEFIDELIRLGGDAGE